VDILCQHGMHMDIQESMFAKKKRRYIKRGGENQVLNSTLVRHEVFCIQGPFVTNVCIISNCPKTNDSIQPSNSHFEVIFQDAPL
jgi:hypothetical protein